MGWMIALWLVILIGGAIAEGATMGLVCIWFSLGALVALVATLLGAAVWLQVTLFLVASAAAILATWPLCRRVLKRRKYRTNADRNLGDMAVCTERISNLEGSGAVYLQGKTWTARSVDGSIIETESRVRVEAIEGVKLMVSLMRAPETTQS